MMESKEMESQGYNHKELNSANNPMNRKEIIASSFQKAVQPANTVISEASPELLTHGLVR